MHLLPNLRDDATLLQALEQNNNTMSRKLIILIGNTDKKITSAAAQKILANISETKFFGETLTGISTEQTNEIGKFYYSWRQVLLSDIQRRAIANANWGELQKELTQSIYSPVSGINATILANDPLLTFYHFIRSLPATEGKIQNDNGTLIIHGGDRDYRVIIVTLTQDVFDMNFHPKYEQWRNKIRGDIQSLYPETQLLLAGAIEHATWGATSAKREISIIGNGSLIGIVLLILMVFPGIKPLLVSLLPLGTGIIAGLIMTVWCFGEIHLITLIFGSSVIGVAMDYSLHYMSEHYKNSMQDSATLCMQRIFPGITFAMITSVIAYTAIGFAPFPVLRQISLFSCAGLITAWITVYWAYPKILPSANYKNKWFLKISGEFDFWLQKLFTRKYSKHFLALLTLAMLPGIIRIHANDDLRLLQSPDKNILEMENKIKDLTGIQASVRFFLVEGSTQEQLLQRLEQLHDWNNLNNKKTIIDMMSDYIPSEKRQKENFLLLKSLYINQGNNKKDGQPDYNFSEQWQSIIGLSKKSLDDYKQLFLEEPRQYMTLDNLKVNSQEKNIPESSFLKTLERFQLHTTERGFMSAAPVRGIDDTSSLRNYADHHPGVHWMDTVADISQMFRHYRENTGWIMLLAYGLIALLLCWRHKPQAAIRILMAPALAAWLTMGFLGYAGVAINLFHVLALLLVLGVGIDYSIFFAESHQHRDTTMLAVILSTITTFLSFGLLSLSQTAAISSFGVVVSIGIVCSLIFSPLAQYHPPSSQKT